MIRLDQDNYTVNELDGGLQVCVMLSEGFGIEDEDFFVEVSVSVSNDILTGPVAINLKLIVSVNALIKSIAKIATFQYYANITLCTAEEDFGDPVPSTVIINSTTPASGACAVINIESDGLEEGPESFTVTIAADDQPVLIEGGGSASVLIVELCEVLTAPVNGSVDVPAREIGSVATYGCDNGFEFIIDCNPQRTCQADLTWSGDAPTCLGIYY